MNITVWRMMPKSLCFVIWCLLLRAAVAVAAAVVVLYQ